MRRTAGVAGILVLALAACEVPQPRPGRVEATSDTMFVVALGGRALVLDGFAGDLRLAPGADPDSATVRITRRARGATATSAALRLRAVRVETASAGEIEQIVWRTSLDAGTSADATVRVPPGATVVARVGAGTVRARGLDGGLLAEADSGAVSVEAFGGTGLRLRVRRGEARLSGRRVPPGARWTASVGAGDVRLALPADASAEVVISSARGTVQSSLPLADVVQDGRLPAARLRGRLGEGAAIVRVHTAQGRAVLAPSGP